MRRPLRAASVKYEHNIQDMPAEKKLQRQPLAAAELGPAREDKVIPISHSPIKKLVLWAWSSIRVKLEA